MVFRFAVLLALSAVASLSAFTARSAESSTETAWPVLPGQFGLAHGLHWGMNVAEVRADLPDLTVTPDLPNNFLVVDDPQFAHTATGKSLWAGCPLTYALRFFDDRLDEVRISTAIGGKCRAQAESTLFTRYHERNLPLACPNIIHRRWSDAATDASYDYDCNDFNDYMQIQLRNTTDVSRRAADRPRWAKCRSFITTEFLAGQDSDRATDPELSTADSPNLGCNPDEYPALSARLLGAGSAVLQAEFAEDGTVRDAQLLTSSGKKRLDDAALALVREKLRFRPAQKDGMPVAVTRQLRIGFRLANQVFANGTVGYACNLPGTNPCNGAPLAIDLAPARAGAMLKVSSPNIRPGEPLAEAVLFSGDARSPELNWTTGPPGTQSYALVAEQREFVGTAEHWIMYDIPASALTLPAGIPNDARVPNPIGAINAGRVGRFPGYVGIPARAREHIQIFALDTELGLDPITVTRASLIAAMNGHVLASGELVVGGGDR